MTKEPDKHVWETNYQNKSISGIEVKDKNGRVVHFIAIRHDEALHDIKTHRVTIKLDGNGRPILPPPQTFDEIMQAKRRQQMLLYGSGALSTNTSSLNSSNGATARRAAAATKRAKANLNRRSLPAINIMNSAKQPEQPQQQQPQPQPQPQPTASTSSRRSAVPSRRKSSGIRRSSNKKRPKKVASPPQQPVTPEPEPEMEADEVPSVNHAPPNDSFECEETLANSSFETQISTTSSEPVTSIEQPIPSSSSQPIVTSMKDLNKNNPIFKIMDPKALKQLVRSALPGSSITLPNGTVITKSRRGGARAGAGRKRSRPMPDFTGIIDSQSPQSSSAKTSPRSSTTSMNGNNSMQASSTDNFPIHQHIKTYSASACNQSMR